MTFSENGLRYRDSSQGIDLMNQLKDKELGEALLIPENMVRVEEKCIP